MAQLLRLGQIRFARCKACSARLRCDIDEQIAPSTCVLGVPHRLAEELNQRYTVSRSTRVSTAYASETIAWPPRKSPARSSDGPGETIVHLFRASYPKVQDWLAYKIDFPSLFIVWTNPMLSMISRNYARCAADFGLNAISISIRPGANVQSGLAIALRTPLLEPSVQRHRAPTDVRSRRARPARLSTSTGPITRERSSGDDSLPSTG